MNRTVKLKNISSIIGSGITPSRGNHKYWVDGTIPWLKTGQLGEHKIYDTSEKITVFALENTGIKLFPENTLSIALYGEGKTRGNVSILKSEMTTNQACCNVVIDKTKADYEFVYYLLKTKYNQLRNLSSGVRKNLNADYIKELEINLPNNISTQQKIASVLSSLDSKIELNNRINAELESMAKTLYDYWFVQFDFPDKKGKPYKTSGGKMFWNEELKREIPEGWEVDNLKINSLAELIKPGIEEFEGEKIYLATSDVVDNEINLKAKKITFESRESRANMQPIENSIWFAKMKKSKKVLYFSIFSIEFLNNYILSTGFAGIKCQKHALEFLWNFINNKNFEFIKDRLSTGATQEAINNDLMIYIPLVVPKNEILEKYHRKTHVIYNLIYNNKIENQKLSELRDWLLPMLMNGQVRVV